MTYEAVGVLGAGAAAGTLAMAAVAHVRPETSTVTLLCTHRLCHCERKKRKKRKRGVSRTGTQRQSTLPASSWKCISTIWEFGISEVSGRSAVDLENSPFSHKNIHSDFFFLKQLHLMSSQKQLKNKPPDSEQSEVFVSPPSTSKAVPADRNPPVPNINFPAIGASTQVDGSCHSLAFVSCFQIRVFPKSIWIVGKAYFNPNVFTTS